MSLVKNGFVTALGTPIDEKGNLVEASLRKHIEQQIEAGASGLLLMGSMGIEAYLTTSTYADVVRVAVDAVAGRLPLFVGAMDTSIAKVAEKIKSIGDAKIDALVLTVPFYAGVDDEQAIKWFSDLADISPAPVYVYDLPGVTKYKVNMNVISNIINHKNIKGIKSADWELIHQIGRTFPDVDFECLYSGLDSFDYANVMGIKKNLDGMFCCTPKNATKMYECCSKGDYAGARVYLDKILLLRNTMLAHRLMPCFTHCMNLLGCEGFFHQDYCVDATDESKAIIRDVMKQIGEL